MTIFKRCRNGCLQIIKIILQFPRIPTFSDFTRININEMVLLGSRDAPKTRIPVPPV
jgi:hypothetical protein